MCLFINLSRFLETNRWLLGSFFHFFFISKTLLPSGFINFLHFSLLLFCVCFCGDILLHPTHEVTHLCGAIKYKHTHRYTYIYLELGICVLS